MKSVSLLSIFLLAVITQGHSANWPEYRDQVSQDKSLVRYYTFEEPGDEVRNLAGDKRGPLMLAFREPYYHAAFFPQRNVDFPQRTEGRFPGKPALSIGSANSGAMRSMFYNTPSGVLTLETWIRTHASPGEKAEAILFSVGTGSGDGWLLRTDSQNASLRIGRPAGEGGDVQLDVKPLAGHVWHHLVAELDHHVLRLYVDGELAGSKEFAGDFKQPVTPGGYFALCPEADGGGLKIGSIREPDNTLRFDCDELALYDRALPAEEIRAHFESGRSPEPAAEQESAHRTLLEKQAMLAGIKIEIPPDSFGYFPAGKPAPLTVVVPTTVKLASPLAVEVSIHDGGPKPVFSGAKSLDLSGKGEARLDWELPFPKTCGLYQIDIALKDPTGAVVLTKSYPVAATVAVAPMSERPESSPLAGHGIFHRHNEDLAIGGRYERILNWNPKLPDGRPGFQYTDPHVSLAEAAGIGILYCIDPQPPGTVDWTKVEADPTEWENWVRAIVEHYKGRVKYWEILNEPNAGKGITPARYAALLKSACRVIREVDPASKIVGLCGVSSYPEWTEDVLAAGGGGTFDILSFHNYLGSSPILAWRRDRKIERTQAAMVKHLGKTLPIWNTESGIHQPLRSNGRALDDAGLLAKYPTRSRQENGHTLVSADAVTLATEHVGACWQTQSILLDCALGVERWFTLMGASNFYLRNNNNVSSGCPSEKGIAYAALAKVLTPMKSCRLLPISSSSAAGVLVTSLDGKKTAALFADVPTTRCFTVKQNRTYLGMDYFGNPLKWEAQGNLLTVAFGMEPVYIFDVPEDFQEAPFLQVKSFQALVSPGDKVDGVLSVTNLLSSPLAGELKLASPQSTLSFAKEIRLQPGESQDVPFRLQAGPLPRGNHVLVASLSQNGEEIAATESQFSSEGVAQGVPLTARAIQLDGDPSDWQGIREETSDTATHVVIGRPPVGYYDANAWQGPKDLSFTVKTAWRAGDGIYFFLTVTDDNLKAVPPDQVPRGFLQDALELFFDGRPLKDQAPVYSFGVEQVVVVPALGDTAQPCLFKNLARYGDSLKLEVVGKKTPAGYVMEGRIRPGEKSPFKLVAGARFGMDFVMDDAAEAPMTRKTQMALHGTAENAGDSSRFGRYVLMGGDAEAVSNLLLNADLAKGEGEAVPSWRFSKELKDAAAAAKFLGSVKEVDGKRALCISISTEAQAQGWWEQTVPAKGETAYAVSFRLKGKLEGKAGYCIGQGRVYFLGAQGAWLGAQMIGQMDATSAGDWGTFNGNILAPAGTQTITFRFNALSGGVKGTADFYCTYIVLTEQKNKP